MSEPLDNPGRPGGEARVTPGENKLPPAGGAEELLQSSRIIRMVSECNQALVRADDELELMQDLCRIILDVGGYRMAWVGYAQDDGAKSVLPVASVGFESGYLQQAGITYADVERGRGPTGAAIRTGQVRMGRDFLNDPELAPWRQQAIERGYRSSIALPLKADGKTFGALTIYSPLPDAFPDAQAAILTELANDLAFGIVALRTRTDLQASRRELQQVLHSAPVIIWAVDCDNIFTLADGRLELLGLESRHVVGRHFKHVFGDLPSVLAHIGRAKGGEIVAAEVEFCGLLLDSRYSALLDHNGNTVGVTCVATDITHRRRTEREVLDAAQREQRRIGRDLHDSIQGSLAGIRFMLDALGQRIVKSGADPQLGDDVARIAQVVSDTLDQTRGLARGLCPVELRADGLMKAFDQLATTTSGMFRIACRFQCEQPVLIEDENTAAQLYYIAQEAVNNAMKHGKARCITIRLDHNQGSPMLDVHDDGVGIPDERSRADGMGLRTMDYRAKMIGANLSVRRADAGGTLVRCSLQSV